MNGNWSVQLEDGPHTVSAEILTGMLTFKLKVIWDGSVIEETRIPALLGQILTTFQRSGHMFVIRQSGFGMIGKLVLAMDGRELAASGATQIASTPRPAPSALQFVEETEVREWEDVVGTEEYPIDNRYGNQTFTTARTVSREATNELSVDSGNSLGGKVSLDVMSAIKGEIEAQVSHHTGQKIGAKFTESQTLTFSAGASSAVVYEVVWKRKARTGVWVYSAGGGMVRVPYRVDYGLSFEVRTKALGAS